MLAEATHTMVDDTGSQGQTGTGEPRSAREIDHHFERNYGVSGAEAACEYLADQGLIGKAAVSTRLTKRSNVDIEELAFFAMTDPPDPG